MKITATELRKIINETVMSKIVYHNTHQILEVDTDGSGDLSPDELRDLADDLEGEPITGQELRDALISNISDMHKDIYRKRPDAHDLRQLSTEELEQEHHKTSEAHKDWWYEERHREDQDMWIADEDSEIEALMDPEEGEDEPKQIGMGRRPLVGPARDVRRGKKISENKMKITRRQLRQTIFEACGGGCDSVDSPSEHADSDWKNSDSVNTLGDIDDMRPQDAFALGLVIGRSNNLDNMSDPPTVEDAFYPEEVEAREDAWSGGDNIEDPLDHADFETGESNTGPHVSTIKGCAMREMKITRRQLKQIIREELLREGDDPPFEDDWFNQNWSKLKSKIESELVGPYGTGAGMEPGLIQEEDLEPIWKSIFGTQFPGELDMIEAELDDKILSRQGGKQESGYTLRQLEKIIKDLDSKFYFVPAEQDRETNATKSKGHRVKGIAGPDAVPADELKRAEIIRKLRK
tara:strand:+ start:4179 stop:5570 length:1392 start_codon:yes stop_codon:yes gene_type:complete